MELEIWKPWLKNPNYEISNMGRVKSLAREVASSLKHVTSVKRKEKLLEGFREGYRVVTLYWTEDGQRHTGVFKISRLVLELFVGPPDQKTGNMARHLNDVRTDDRLENLAWGAHKDNALDAIQNGKWTTSQRNGNSKLTPDQVDEIRSAPADKNGRYGQKEFAEKFGVSRRTVWLARTGKTYVN